MKTVTREEAIKILRSERNSGRIFSATFTKKDGTSRIMNCRNTINSKVKGVGMRYTPSERNLLNVYDNNARGFRMINLNTLSAFQIRGQKYIVVQ